MTEELHRRPRTPTEPEAVEAARAYLTGTLDALGLRAAVVVRTEGEDTILEVTGEDAAEVVGKKAATLDALQLLCNRVVAKVQRGDRTPLVLDAAGYRARREASLQKMAEQAGSEAVHRGKVITLEPMPPRERRVVHMALARFPGVRTESEGDGEERRIRIIPMPPPGPARG